MKKPETYIVVFTLFALLAVVNLLLSFGIYQRTRDSVVTDVRGNSNQSESTRSDIAVSDLKTLLGQSPLRRNSYQLIGDKNLFSPERTAWQSPVVDKAEAGDVVVSPVSRSDVALYGIFKLGEKKGALLEFTSLKKDQRKKTMFPGDTVSSPGDRKKRSYTLLSVKPASVVIKDQNGVVFNVDLYKDKKVRHKAVETKTSISVNSDDTAPKSSAVVVGSSRSVEAGAVVNARKAAVQLQRQVAAGELKKISTPFGTAYVKDTAAKAKRSPKE